MENTKETPRSSFQVTEFTRWDHIPKFSDWAYESIFVDLSREWKYKANGILNDSLLPDLWRIVCSFLIGYADHFVISVTLKTIIDFRLFEWRDPRCTFNNCGDNRITHFYGSEDGEAFLFFFRSWGFRVSGHFPLQIFEYMSTTHFNLIDEPSDVSSIGKDIRFLLGISPNITEFSADERPRWFVWDKRMTKIFFSKDEAHQFYKNTKSVFQMFCSKNGHCNLCNLPICGNCD
jgi:hypothetical protein